MRNKYFIASTPILLGIMCLVISGMVGSRIEPDGTLVEPAFFLIPLSYLFLFSGIATILTVAVISTFKKTIKTHG